MCESILRADCHRWGLDTKMLPTVWQCLPLKTTLKRLTIKFPSTRDPRPITLAPAIPSLESLNIHDIDPLCYADDISTLLYGSKKITDLTLHWSPRMRDACEPSIHPAAYFGKMTSHKYKMPLRALAMGNFFVSSMDVDEPFFDGEKIEEVTALNCKGSIGSSGSAFFVEHDEYQRMNVKCVMPGIKMIRIDKISKLYCDQMYAFNGMERIYLVNPQTRAKSYINGSQKRLTPISQSPGSTTSSPGICDTNAFTALKDAYLDAITTAHGATVRHLLLLPQWRLNSDDIARLVRLCPNLEQLAFGFEADSVDHLRLLLPFLSKLTAVRFLSNPDDSTFTERMRRWDDEVDPTTRLERAVNKTEYANLRYAGLGGDDLIFSLGPRYSLGWDGEGQEIFRRDITKIPRSAVSDIAIWKMDSSEL